MTALEQRMAAGHGADLVVFDGPLRGRNDPLGGRLRQDPARAVPARRAAGRWLGRLGDGERTPLFLLGAGAGHAAAGTSACPGRAAHPLSGIVRCEVRGRAARSATPSRRADAVSRALPRFASEAHKDPRAPQNLYPIAGLEQRLRHLLGDPVLIERALRRAATAA